MGMGMGMGMAPAVPPANARVYRDLAYVINGHERQMLDLFLPAQGENLPLIIYFHGGAFRAGSKSTVEPMPYVEKGYAVASVGYRLVQHATFPAQVEDAKAAVRWLRANAGNYGVDPDRFAAWGQSAGAYHAAMLGVSHDVKDFEVGENLDVSSAVQVVIDVSGPSDFSRLDEQRPPNSRQYSPEDAPEAMLIGGPIKENPLIVERANPVTYVDAGDAPFLIIHGDADGVVPYPQAVIMASALEAAMVPVEFYTVSGGGHGRFDDSMVEELIGRTLARYLK